MANIPIGQRFRPPGKPAGAGAGNEATDTAEPKGLGMRIRWTTRIATMAGVICLIAGIAAGGGGTAQASPAAPSGTGYVTGGQLLGVGTAGPASAWAVGYTGTATTPKTLMLHWNGSAWSKVTAPAVLNGSPGQLSGITVVSAKDAWAVGFTGAYPDQRPLLLHWNGSAWSAVPSPKPIVGALSAVTATASGGWAVGATSQGNGEPLILRLKGTAWSQVSAPSDPEGATLGSVAITGANTAWAAGDGNLEARITGRLARWNGTSWSWVTSFPILGVYHYLTGLAAGPEGTAWAVGEDLSASTVPLSMRLTGSAWVKAAVSLSQAATNGVTVAPGGTAWLFGSASETAGGRTATVIARWTGRAWQRVSTPSPTSDAEVSGSAFATAGNGWAVGASNLSSSPNTLILHWNGSAWS